MGARVVAGGLVAAAILLGGCSSGGPKPTGRKIDLKLNLKKGDRRKLTADMDMKMHMTSPDKKQKATMNMSMGFGMSFDVLDVDSEGNHTLKANYDRLRVDITGGPVNVHYDSAKPAGPENLMAQMFGAMVGQSLTMKVTPKGKRLEVTGLDELAEKMGSKLPPAARAGVDQQAKSMTSAFDRMMASFPKEPVDIRDSWSGTMDMAADPNTPMTVDAKYTLYDRKNGKAIVKIDGTIRSSKGLSGTMEGTVTIDEATGWTEGGEMTMNMSGTTQGLDAEMEGKFSFGS